MRMVAADGTEYIALQMHFHWGGASSEISGSEHTIDGIRYVTEVPSGPPPGASPSNPMATFLIKIAEKTLCNGDSNVIARLRVPFSHSQLFADLCAGSSGRVPVLREVIARQEFTAHTVGQFRLDL